MRVLLDSHSNGHIHKSFKGKFIHLLFLQTYYPCYVFSKNKQGTYRQITVQDSFTVDILQGLHQFFHHVVSRCETQVDPLLQCVVTQLCGEVVSSIGRLFNLKHTLNNYNI